VYGISGTKIFYVQKGPLINLHRPFFYLAAQGRLMEKIIRGVVKLLPPKKEKTIIFVLRHERPWKAFS
jgi:hypothetical protein